MMTQCVVDLLESVEIDEHQRQRFPVPLRQADGLTAPFMQQRTVRQARQGVEMRQPLYLLLRLLAFGHVVEQADIVGELARGSVHGLNR